LPVVLGIILANPALVAADEFAEAIQSLASNYVTLDHKCTGIVLGLVDEQGIRVITCGKSGNPECPLTHVVSRKGICTLIWKSAIAEHPPRNQDWKPVLQRVCHDAPLPNFSWNSA